MPVNQVRYQATQYGENFFVCKHDQTCCLHFRHLTLMRVGVINPYVLLNLIEIPAYVSNIALSYPFGYLLL